MYTPLHFAETDLAQLDRLVERDAFVTLVSVDDGVPHASHLPVLYRREGDAIELRGHWARPNPQWRHAGTVLAIVHGPHAYVSPGGYSDTESAARVPTWNYAVAHLRGVLDIHEDPAFLAAVVSDLSEKYEAASGGDWRFQPENPAHGAQLRGIVGFRMRVDAVELKFKLNQNHPAANVRGAAAALGGSGREGDREIHSLMLQRLAQRNKGSNGA
jgi:transcriptional regulator